MHNEIGPVVLGVLSAFLPLSVNMLPAMFVDNEADAADPHPPMSKRASYRPPLRSGACSRDHRQRQGEGVHPDHRRLHRPPSGVGWILKLAPSISLTRLRANRL